MLRLERNAWLMIKCQMTKKGSKCVRPPDPPSGEGCVVGGVQQSPSSQIFGVHECSSLTHTSHASNGVLLDGFMLEPVHHIMCLLRVSAPSPLWLIHRCARLLLVPSAEF